MSRLQTTRCTTGRSVTPTPWLRLSTKQRTLPNSSWSTIAWYRTQWKREPVNASYDAASRPLHAVRRQSESRTGLRMTLAAVIGFGPEHKLRVISEDVGRRIRLESLQLRGRGRVPVGRPANRKTGEVDGQPLRSVSHRRPRPRSRDPRGTGAGCRITGYLGLRVHTQANVGRVPLDVRVTRAHLRICTAALRAVRYPCDPRQCDCTLHQHDTSRRLPGRRTDRKPGTSPNGSWTWQLAKSGWIPPSFGARNFIRAFPHETPVDMTYDTGDFQAHLDKALEMIQWDGV